MTEVKYVAAQKAWLAMTELNEGDKVRVMRAAETKELGWQDVWTSSMAAAVGKEYVVTRIYGRRGLQLNYNNGTFFPFFVLDPVRKHPESSLVGKEVSVTIDGKTYKAVIKE
jgi:hypothetical protein